MPDDERNQEQDEPTEPTEDVEAHGVKEIAGIGLAAAALIGASAVGVKIAKNDDSPRNQAALVETSGDLKAADLDGDGYVNYRELVDVGFKWDPAELNAEGIEVTAEGLAAAGGKIPIEAVGGEGGFALKENTIFLKFGVEPELDEMIKGSAIEWTEKQRQIDPDGDGYASYDELGDSYKWNVDALNEAGYKVAPEDLAKAEYKMDLASLGEGGFETKEGMIMLKYGVDEKLDAIVEGGT